MRVMSPSISMRSVPMGSVWPDRFAARALIATLSPPPISVWSDVMSAARSASVSVASKEPIMVLFAGAASPASGSAMASTK